MAKGKKFFLQKANVMVCNTSGIFMVLLGIMTFVVYKYSFKAHATTDNIPYDYITASELANVIPQIGFKTRQINVDQQIMNTTSLYYHLEELNYTKNNFNHDQNEFFLLSIRIQNEGKSSKKGLAPNFDIERMHNVSANGLSLGQNLLHLNYPGGNTFALKNAQSEFDTMEQYIYTYYRKETESFIEDMNNHYMTQLDDYFIYYYLFTGFKLLLYLIFIFRMYSAISVLNKVKISFEEYSRSKRGFLLFILFVLLAVSTFIQLKYFNEYSNNTQSVTQLSTSLIHRYVDLQYASNYIFESILLGSSKIYGYNEIMQNILTKIEQNDDKIFKTTKGNMNKLSSHFSQFSTELLTLQTQFQCKSYFEFQFKYDDCTEFCKTELKFYDMNKQLVKTPTISEFERIKKESKFVCSLPKGESGSQGIQTTIKGLKQHIRQIREEHASALVNDQQSTQTTENKNARAFEFMYKQYLKFPEFSLYNIRIHNDYLIKLLCQSYKNYLNDFDSYIYLYIFSDLIIGTVFLILWAFYYLYLIKGLSKHKSKFEELKAGQE